MKSVAYIQQIKLDLIVEIFWTDKDLRVFLYIQKKEM